MEQSDTAKLVRYVVSGEHPEATEFDRFKLADYLKGNGWDEEFYTQYSYWKKNFYDKRTNMNVVVRLFARHWDDSEHATLQLYGGEGDSEGEYSVRILPVSRKQAQKIVDVIKAALILKTAWIKTAWKSKSHNMSFEHIYNEHDMILDLANFRDFYINGNLEQAEALGKHMLGISKRPIDLS